MLSSSSFRCVVVAAVVVFTCLQTFDCFEVVDPPKATTGRGKEKMMVILLDGYRWDYPDKSGMGGFTKIKQKGVTAKHLIPVFPAMSYPNYQSLVTGLYAEDHGIVMNHIYDEGNVAFFWPLPSVSSTQAYWWDEAEPIWITATKRELKTVLYHWPGCEVTINGTRPTFCRPYEFHNSIKTFHDNLVDAINGLQNNTADLILIYCEYPDYIGHTFGPESDSMTNALKAVDSEIKFLVDKFEETQLENTVNVLIVSDHGMTRTDNEIVERISLDTVLNMNDVNWVLDSGAIVGIFTRKVEKVYNDLSRLKEKIYVWKKEDIPEEYHLKNHSHTPSIIVLARRGFFIEPIKNNDKQIPTVATGKEKILKGSHGYDPKEVEDMMGIFYAYGPGFEDGMLMPPIDNVDIYNIMVHLLDVTGHPNRGNWKKVFKYIEESNGAPSCNLWYDIMSTVLACIGCLYMYSLVAFF